MKRKLFILLLFANVFFANASTRMSGYRWRNDDGNETAASWKTPAAGTPVQITDFAPIRLRIAVEEYANSGYSVQINVNAMLEYSENGGAWQSITAPGSKFAFVNSAYLSDDTPTTQQLSSGAFAGGKFKSSGNNTAFTMLTYYKCEHEFCIRPLETIATSATYTFRIPNLSGPETIQPTLTTAAVLCTTPMVYTITGGGNGCESSGLEVVLDGSQAGMNYQLKRDGIAVGGEVPGNGGILSFGLQTVSGDYTVDALNTTNGCNLIVAMNGNAVVDINPVSAGGDVTGGNTVCKNSPSGWLTLTGNVGDILYWESSVNPFTVWTPIANTTAGYDPGVLTETTKFRAISQSGSCDPAISTETTAYVTATEAPSGAAVQIYAGTAVFADLTVSGSGVKWYTEASNGTELASTENVTDGETYYASQSADGCESIGRLAVTVRKISETAQSFCGSAAVEDLQATPTTGQTAQWYYDAAGTSPVMAGTGLSSGTYYVAQHLPSVVSTFAGSGTAGTLNATGTTAQFNKPRGVVTDSQGNLFVADYSNSRIRKITPAGVVTTFAGGTGLYTDATATAAGFNQPHGIAIDGSDNLYIGDSGNSRIRKITPGAAVTTMAGQSMQGDADGNGTAAQFSNPSGVTVDLAGNIYVADVTNFRIRKITPTGDVTTFAGSTNGFSDAQGTAAQFSFAYDVVTDSGGNIYVADINNHVIRKITPAGDVTTFAGSTQGYADGVGTAALFNSPRGVAVDASDNIYVTDAGNRRIRKITPSGVVTTVAGSGASGTADGNGDVAEFGISWGLTVDSTGVIYLADTNNNKIRKIIQGSQNSNLIAVSVTVNPLSDTSITQSGDTLTVAETGAGYQWNVCETNGIFTPIAGATDQAYLATTVGSYSVEVTKNGCPAMSSCFEIAALGNPDFDFSSKVTVYPNPSGNVFYITSGGHATIAVFDLVGKAIRTQEIFQGDFPLDLSQYPGGIYLLKVTNDDNQVKTIKLVKE